MPGTWKPVLARRRFRDVAGRLLEGDLLDVSSRNINEHLIVGHRYNGSAVEHSGELLISSVDLKYVIEASLPVTQDHVDAAAVVLWQLVAGTNRKFTERRGV
jgi:hypothetical protein